MNPWDPRPVHAWHPWWPTGPPGSAASLDKCASILSQPLCFPSLHLVVCTSIESHVIEAHFLSSCLFVLTRRHILSSLSVGGLIQTSRLELQGLAPGAAFGPPLAPPPPLDLHRRLLYLCYIAPTCARTLTTIKRWVEGKLRSRPSRTTGTDQCK